MVVYVARGTERHTEAGKWFGRVVQITIPELQLHAKHDRLEILPGGEVRVTPSCLSGVGLVVESLIGEIARWVAPSVRCYDSPRDSNCYY